MHHSNRHVALAPSMFKTRLLIKPLIALFFLCATSLLLNSMTVADADVGVSVVELCADELVVGGGVGWSYDRRRRRAAYFSSAAAAWLYGRRRRRRQTG